MSSKGTTIITPDASNPTRDVQVFADGATNALLVKVVNPGAGGGGGTEYAEDTPHTTGDFGTMALVVRKDAAGSLVSADGDYAPLQVDASGALRVVVVSGGSGGGGVQYDEDAPHTSGATGTLALVVRNDTPGSLASADGDYAVMQADSAGRLRVAVDASVALTVGDGGGSLTVDGSVSVSNFPTVYPVNDNGGSLTVDGAVSVTQGGAFLVVIDDGGASITVDGAVSVSNFPTVYPVNDNGGSLTVDGTLAVTQSGAWSVGVIGAGDVDQYPLEVYKGADPWPSRPNGIAPMCQVVDTPSITTGTWSAPFLSENTGGLLVEVVSSLSNVNLDSSRIEDTPHASGAVGQFMLAVRNDAGTALAGTDLDYIPFSTDNVGQLRVTVGAVVPGTGATNLGKIEDAAHVTGDVGVMALAVRNDAGTALAGTNGDYAPFSVDANGNLRTTVTGIVAGTAATQLCKAEDAVAANGDAGVMTLAVRRDTLVSSTSANGDYSTFSVDALGALWTRIAGVTTVVLSGSTRGRPIQITGTTSGAAVTLHTATTTAGQLDRVYIDLTNTSDSAVRVTIEFGTTGAGNELNITVPPRETVKAVDGLVIGGAATDTIRAYAATGSVINAVGRVERLT
jgi:hypothetical protein